MGRRVVATAGRNNKDRRIGKVRRFVFHPTEKRLIGIVVKRPDVALMFHRKDLFVALDGFSLDGDVVRLTGEERTAGAAAIKRLGVDWNRCVLWLGMPLVTESGEALGRVGTVTYRPDGSVVSLEVDAGGTSRALLGTEIVPAELIRGFRFGVGARMIQREPGLDDGNDDAEAAEERVFDDEEMGAIVVADETVELSPEGGLAEAAGKGTAKAREKGKQVAEQAKAAGAEAAEKAKPKVDEATEKAGEAINKGAYKLGEQIGKSRSMFSSFMDEYRAASSDTEEEDK